MVGMDAAALSSSCACMQNLVTRDDIAYICLTFEKLADLIRDVGSLSGIKKDVEEKLEEEEEKHGKTPTHEIMEWLQQCETTIKEAEELREEYAGKCFASGFCSINCCSRHNIGRRAVRLSNRIKDLKKERNDFKVLAEKRVTNVAHMRSNLAESIIDPYLKKIKNHLQNVAVNVIGIYGLCGVGKTTLLQALCKSISDDKRKGDIGMKHFDQVVIVEDSQNLDLETILRKIAEKLTLPNECLKGNIQRYLKDKNFLFLLDNICERVDFVQEVGIPLGGNKVIFTALNRGMCSDLGACRIIEMRCLEDEELAWYLFNQHAKIETLEFDASKDLAKQVVNKCSGLPLALTLFGQVMSGVKTIQEWQHVVDRLNRLDNTNYQKIEDDIYKKLKANYESLDDPKLKKCFSSFSLWYNYSPIYKEDIIQCWMGLGYIVFSKYNQAYDEGCYLLGRLEKACLLKVVGDEVKLSDLMLRMAHWVATEEGVRMDKWIVRSNSRRLGGNILPEDMERWRHAERISVTNDNQITVVPQLHHSFPSLVSLMLQGNSQLKSLPRGIFQHMKKLEYLDLSSTGIDELPACIKDAANLQYLNISRSRIVSLPNELALLKELKFLICRELKLSELTEGLVSSLYRLGVLELQPFALVPVKCLKALTGSKRNMKRIGMLVKSIEVFNLLRELPTCYIQIEELRDVESIPFGSLSCRNRGCLEILKITACDGLKELVVVDGSESDLKNLHLWDLSNLSMIKFNGVEPRSYFQKLRELYIAKCKCLKSLPWVLHLPALVSLKIEQCEVLKELVGEQVEEIQQVSEDHHSFRRLETMNIRYLPNLLSISNHSLIFPCLSDLIVEGCPKLNMLPFDSRIITSKLTRLECEEEWWDRLAWTNANIKSHVETKIKFIDPGTIKLPDVCIATPQYCTGSSQPSSSSDLQRSATHPSPRIHPTECLQLAPRLSIDEASPQLQIN